MVVASTNFSAPVEGVLLQNSSTKLLINNLEIGTATLYITENNVVWGGGAAASGGPSPPVSILYPNISLHAVQREPSPALYLVLNYELRLPNVPTGTGDSNEAQNDNEDEEFDADDQPITQIRFIPENENDLQLMFSAMCQGQALHPDPQDESEDDPYMNLDDDDEEFEDAQENDSSDEAAGRMQQLRIENLNGSTHYEDCEDVENE
ncbi:methylosome subunit pICln-like [Pieris brassicae]|uniref:Methylosome subunit pICln n=1 Tax=Pieris brassicae TaxID=7116 RepID=A0A9P0TTX8_PIEBR|nr:methylosome subunit pICln-like [Pieris brassicae]CAH4037432.1 unnamed protein product [Pieris brassicae]